MKQFFIRIVHFYLLVVLFVCCHTASFKGPKRPLSSLQFPHPSQYAWDTDADLHEEAKRFPKFLRTGRSGHSLSGEGDLRNGGVHTGGMWFGPRIGRLQKRDSIYQQDNPWAYLIFGENPVARQVHYTPRLGRESEENYEEDTENA